MKIPKGKWGDLQSIPIGMSTNVYKEMVKEMNITMSRDDPSQQRASEVYNHLSILLCT